MAAIRKSCKRNFFETKQEKREKLKKRRKVLFVQIERNEERRKVERKRKEKRKKQERKLVL